MGDVVAGILVHQPAAVVSEVAEEAVAALAEAVADLMRLPLQLDEAVQVADDGGGDVWVVAISPPPASRRSRSD